VSSRRSNTINLQGGRGRVSRRPRALRRRQVDAAALHQPSDARPREGEIRVGGQLTTNDREGLRELRRNVAMIFQHYNVVPRLSVLEERADRAARVGQPARCPGCSCFRSATSPSGARIVCGGSNSKTSADTRTDKLSGGQKQRVGIARALAQHPKMILADEPVSSLDPKTSRTVLRYLKQASQDLGITVVCNLHQVEYAREFAERVVGVSNGRVVFEGSPAQLDDEVLHRIYPGLDDSGEQPASPAPEEAPGPAEVRITLEDA
jgi:phosphonate transport system ATP-binding protein